MFMILCLCSKSIYTLASTAACRSDRTILFEEPGESAHLCLPVIIIITGIVIIIIIIIVIIIMNRSRRFDSNENFRFAGPYIFQLVMLQYSLICLLFITAVLAVSEQ